LGICKHRRSPVGAELARESGVSFNNKVDRHTAIASKLGSYKVLAVLGDLCTTVKPVGAWLTADFMGSAKKSGSQPAGDGGSTVEINVD